MDSPQDRMREQAAARAVRRRDPRRRHDRHDRDHGDRNPGTPPPAPNRGGGGGPRDNPFAKRYSRYTPDPDDPFYTPQRRSAQKTKFGKYLAETDPEAYYGRELAKRGMDFIVSGDPYDQFLNRQYQNFEMGLRQARLDRPNLSIRKYAAGNPFLNSLGVADDGDDGRGGGAPGPGHWWGGTGPGNGNWWGRGGRGRGPAVVDDPFDAPPVAPQRRRR